MKATAKNFFGTNLEQEVLDQIIILPHVMRDNNNGTITLPTGLEWSDLELVDIGLGVSTNMILYGNTTVDNVEIAAQPTSWKAVLIFTDIGGARWVLSVQATSANTATWVGSSTTSDTCWPQYMVGYKRRISRVGIDELMSAMSLPNLIANADLTDNPINQRNFNGNWSSLAVGAYGYDQWMKVSSTHMGYVIEAGKYRPNAKHTFTKDDVVLGEFMSPASGHWIVSVPFATSGKFDLYAGQFKRPWHPVQDGEVRCHRYFFASPSTSFTFDNSEYGAAQISNGSPMGRHIFFPVKMRKVPTASIRSVDSGGLGSHISLAPSETFCYVHLKVNTTVGINPYVYNLFVDADASITLAEVGGQITTIG